MSNPNEKSDMPTLTAEQTQKVAWLFNLSNTISNLLLLGFTEDQIETHVMTFFEIHQRVITLKKARQEKKEQG